MSTHAYSAFGLEVESELTLPLLDPAPAGGSGDPDVTVTRGDVTGATTDWGDDDHHYVDASEFYVSYGVGDTMVRDGREIRIDPAADAPMDIVRRLVVGPLFNYLLSQRDYLVLHASTVEVGDVAVAFAGDSGDGKSTTATAFLAAGHRVLSDDVAAIRTDESVPTVQPGYPAVKLDPDALDALDPDLDARPAEAVEMPRRFYRMADGWESMPVPLTRVYLLEDGPGPEVLSLPAGRQCMALVENTYTRGAFGLREVPTTNFERCATVANAVPVKRLRRPRRFDALPGLVDAVRDDLERCGGPLRTDGESFREGREKPRGEGNGSGEVG